MYFDLFCIQVTLHIFTYLFGKVGKLNFLLFFSIFSPLKIINLLRISVINVCF